MKLSARQRSAFTLLEIMLVVMIIALLLGAAIYKLGGSIGVASDVTALGDLQGISTQLMVYQTTNRTLPTTEQGLRALVTRPTSEPVPRSWRLLLKDVPIDPWGKEYIYVQPGVKNPSSYDLYSSGEDKTPGTSDDIWAQ